MAKTKTTRLEYLLGEIAKLGDDPSEPWQNYPCIEWPFYINHNGYGFIHNKKGSGVFPHRISLEFKLGESIPPGMFSLHRCDNRRCFRPSHVFIGSLADNIHDCIEKGRFRAREPRPKVRGNLNPKAKLQECDVIEIRKLYSQGVPDRMIAVKFEISRTHVWNIATRKTWKHI